MVNPAKRYILLFVFLLGYASTGFTDSPNNRIFNIKVARQTVEYGKALSVYMEINTRSKNNIAKILEPLKADFSVAIVDSNETKNTTRFKIRLYPLKTGNLQIPALGNKIFRSKPIDITVTPAVSADNKPVELSMNKYNQKPWVREQTQIIVSIISTDPDIILSSRNILYKGIRSYPIPQQTTVNIIKGVKYYRHKTGWNIFFLYKQDARIRLPEIEYIKNGVPKYRFHLEPVKIKAVKLPVYVSPAIPVGKLSLSAEYMNDDFLLTQPGKTSVLRYTLSGKAIPGDWLPSLMQQYNTVYNAHIQFTPVDTQTATTPGINIMGSKVVNIAYTPLSNGLLPVDDIHIPYFEPETGLVKTLTFKHKKPLILNIYLQVGIFIITISLLYILVKKALLLLVNKINYYQNISDFKKKLKTAETFNDIKDTLKYFCLAESWPVNISVNQWLARLKSRYIVSEKADSACLLLNNCLYNKNVDVDIAKIRTELGLAVKCRKRRKNYLLKRFARLYS